MCAFRLPSSQPRRLIGGVAVLALAGLGLWLLAGEFDWRAVPRAMGRLNTGAVLFLTAALPLAGFPISMVYLLLGLRFGPLAGLGVVAAITTLHLLGTHWIARSFFRRPLRRLFARHHHRVPDVPAGENTAVSLMVMLAPAIPYFVRNYVLALSGIPLRIYFFVALPVHVARSYVALFLGDFGHAPSHRALAFVGVFYAAQLTVCGGVAWWLRRRHKRLAAARAGAV